LRPPRLRRAIAFAFASLREVGSSDLLLT